MIGEGELVDRDALGNWAAREAIRDCLMRYCRAIDRVDRELLETVYWPEATDDHGSFSGSAQGFMDWVIPLLGSMDQTSHQIGNILFAFHGARVNVESCFTAYHRVRREPGAPYDVIMGGRYVDWFEERNGEWRIRDRSVVYDWVREYPDSADWSAPVLGLTFRTNRAHCPSHALLGTGGV